MPHGWNKDYNHAERLLWQNPEVVLSQIGLKPGDTLIDLGAGDGYFSLPAARIVGETGLVYALDFSAEAIDSLKAQIAEAGLKNIKTIVGNAEGIVLCSGCVDVVLMANVLHDFEHPLKVLANARAMLKPRGVLADLDWKKEPQQIHGPPLAKRLSQDEATAILVEAGFKVVSSTLSGLFHYLILAAIASLAP